MTRSGELMNFGNPYGYKTFCIVRFGGLDVHIFIDPHIWRVTVFFGVLVYIWFICIW